MHVIDNHKARLRESECWGGVWLPAVKDASGSLKTLQSACPLLEEQGGAHWQEQSGWEEAWRGGRWTGTGRGARSHRSLQQLILAFTLRSAVTSRLKCAWVAQ